MVRTIAVAILVIVYYSLQSSSKIDFHMPDVQSAQAFCLRAINEQNAQQLEQFHQTLHRKKLGKQRLFRNSLDLQQLRSSHRAIKYTLYAQFGFLCVLDTFIMASSALCCICDETVELLSTPDYLQKIKHVHRIDKCLDLLGQCGLYCTKKND